MENLFTNNYATNEGTGYYMNQGNNYCYAGGYGNQGYYDSSNYSNSYYYDNGSNNVQAYNYDASAYYNDVNATYSQDSNLTYAPNPVETTYDKVSYVNTEKLALDYVLHKEKLKGKIIALIIGFVLGMLMGEGDVSLGLMCAGFLYIPNKISHAMNCTIIGYVVNYIIFALILGAVNPPSIILLLVLFAGLIDVAVSVVPIVKYNKAMKQMVQ